MIPRTSFNIRNNLWDMYEINEAAYKRFDSSKTAFILVGQADTGEIGPMNWLRKMSAKIFENIEKNTEGYSQSDYAFAVGSQAINFILGTYGDQNANKQFLKWDPLFVPKQLYNLPLQHDADKFTLMVKNAANFYGTDLVGITEIDEKWIYDRNIYKPFIFDDVEHPKETEKEFIIPVSVNKAIVMAVNMSRDFILKPPNLASQAATELGYSKMGFLAISLAEFIRALGYNAIPCMNDTALSIPLAINAGLGQLGRNGLLLTPEYGACLRICKVLTDMPLNTDKPIDYGQTEFCEQCLLCARACPADAISFGDRTFTGVCESNNPGVKKWYVNTEKCLRFWQHNGAACSNCIAACPFTMDRMSPNQCLECERCIAPKCTLQFITVERQKFGY
ncbi:MAG: reductive dehalogenase [Clostridiales bacterium]|mgnify:CR=1 FL=1|jgi:epoxyqueuosine reductase|nr:reductive dehalogenase [Clostridiales bacterium]